MYFTYRLLRGPARSQAAAESEEAAQLHPHPLQCRRMLTALLHPLAVKASFRLFPLSLLQPAPPACLVAQGCFSLCSASFSIPAILPFAVRMARILALNSLASATASSSSSCFLAVFSSFLNGLCSLRYGLKRAFLCWLM